jgi:hypothetical protein
LHITCELSKGQLVPDGVEQRPIDAKEIGERAVRDASVALEPCDDLGEEGI